MAGKYDVTNQLEKDVKRLNSWMIGVILVLGVAAGGMLTNWMAEKQASYENLQDEVQTQNSKVERLTDQTQEMTDQVKQLTEAQKDVQKTLQKTN